MGMADRKPAGEELSAMRGLIRQSMAEGAVGLSTGLIYPPCCFAGTGELVELCGEVARRDGIFVAHMRSESDYLEDAVEEMIEVGRKSGVRVHISHFKVAGRENWGKVDDVLQLVRRARSDGVRITADQYPYIAGSTMLGAILPPWAHSGGIEATLERLAAPEERARIKAAMLDRARAEWDNFWKWSGPEGIVISDISSGRHPDYLGKNLSEAARSSYGTESVSEERAAEFALDLLSRERMGVGMISFSQSEEVLRKIMQEPYVNTCTDGLLGGKPHPRAYGTYPRILGRYVRDQKLLTLEQAVHRMTGLAAKTFGFAGHGSVEVGARANLVAFNPDTVIDLATFTDSTCFPAGIEYVIVGGEEVIAGEFQRETGSGGPVSLAGR
jgi:N-acyl-D-amino-acid deacylase